MIIRSLLSRLPRTLLSLQPGAITRGRAREPGLLSLVAGLTFALTMGASLSTVPVPAEAAQALGSSSSPTELAPVTGPYLLGPEDVLAVTVVNFPNLSTSVTVPPDGEITVPLLAPVSVKGKTTAELEQILKKDWSKYVINPAVSVSLTQKRPEAVLMYGYVNKSGSLPYRPGLKILDALAEVGGPAPSAELSLVTVTHRDGRKQALDLSHPETRGGTPADIDLAPGDVVYVPLRLSEFNVVGEVSRPGSFEYKDNMTVLDALTLVGGVKDNADLSAATLSHKGKAEPLNLKALLQQGDLSLNTRLMPGDVISIPERRMEFSVLGEVMKPGSYDYRDDMTVLDALTAVGGVKDTADLDAATLISHGQEHKLDLDALLRHGDLTINTRLAAGDRIMIPEIRNRTYIFGAVARPGYYAFKPGDRILDALNGAGGPTSEADLGRVNLIHIDKVKNTAVVAKTDLQKFLTKGDMVGNVSLSPGDVLYIPDKRHGFSMNDLWGALTGMNIVGSAVRLLGVL
jgi:protein involved in polysaccharide export with SLBB domain